VAAIYTRRLAAKLLEPAGWTVLYLSDSGLRVILRDIVVCWDNPGDLESFKLGMQEVPSGNLVELLGTPMTPHQMIHLDLRQELVAGEQLLAYTSAAAGPYVSVTGYLFES